MVAARDFNFNARVREHEGTRWLRGDSLLSTRCPENKRTMRFFLHRSENAAGPQFDEPSTPQVLQNLSCSRAQRHEFRPKSCLGSTVKTDTKQPNNTCSRKVTFDGKENILEAYKHIENILTLNVDDPEEKNPRRDDNETQTKQRAAGETAASMMHAEATEENEAHRSKNAAAS